jgi:hypothetical protein
MVSIGVVHSVFKFALPEDCTQMSPPNEIYLHAIERRIQTPRRP